MSSRHEEEFIERVCRSAADRAEVLATLATANLDRPRFVGVGMAIREVAFAAWCVALDEVGAKQLAQAARDALDELATHTDCAVERAVLRAVAEQAEVEAQLELVPDDAVVTGSGCLAAHMVDLGLEPEGGEL